MTGVSPGREFTIYVTHVDTEGPLLRVWGQINKAEAMKIEALILTMNDGFQKGFGAIQRDAQLIPHTTCCAYHDDGFYRARIMRPNSGNGTVLVHFVDYGNVETVSFENIRILNDTKEGIQLQTLQAVVTDFVMDGVLPFKNGWDPSLVDHIKHTLRYNEMTAVVRCVLKSRKRMLKLFFNGEDYSTYMINKRMALPATNDDLANIINVPPPAPPQAPFNQYRQNRPHQPHYLPQSRPLPPNHHQPPESVNQNHYNNNSYQKPKFQNYQNYHHQSQENWRQQSPQQPLFAAPRQSHPNPEAARSPVKSTPKTAQSMVNRVLKYRKYPVLVSFVEDGPLKFAVQPEENLDELTALMIQINRCPLKLLSEPPIPGSVCLGRYSKDATLRRAVVRSVTDTLQAKVFYIDYGSSEILSHSDIYELPLEFAHPYVFSIRFTLSSVQYLIVSEEMKKYFQELVEGKRMVLDVVPPEDSPLMQYGHLWDNDKNILEMLIAKFPGCTENWPELRHLNRGGKKLVHVCYVEGCSKFYVQVDEDTKLLERVTVSLDEYMKTAPPVKPGSIKPGYKCLAHCNVDSQWYRAKVIKLTGNQVVVHYVDYGNNEIISTSALRVVGGDVLTKIPALAIRCMLNEFQGKGLIDELDNHFEKMVMDKVLEIVVMDLHAEGVVVNLFDKGVQPHVNVYEEIKGIVQKMSAVEAQAKIPAPQGPPTRGRSEESNTWNAPDAPKKTRKDEENEHKRQHQTPQEWTNPPQTNQLPQPPRNDRNERPDHRRQDRNDNPPERCHDARTSNPSNRSKPTTPSSRTDRNSSIEKSWNDKDSDTSSRSGGRRGERPPQGGGNRSPRNGHQRSPRDSESSESNFKSPRPSNNVNYLPGRGPRDFGSNNRRPSDSRDNRRSPSTPSSPPKPSKPQQLKIPPPNITLGAIKNCELTYVVSPLDFSILLMPDYQELDGVMNKISEIYESGGQTIPEALIKPGMDCIAQFSVDSKWYRASVEDVTSSGATVLFVDYANTEVVPFDKIKELREEVCKLPAQAVRVKLLAAVEKDWDTNEIATFTSAVEFKTLEAEFVGLAGQIYEILLREVVEGVPQAQYLNEQYCNGADLMKAKELSRNKSRKSQSKKPRTSVDYAPMDLKWKEPAVNFEEKVDVMVTWVMNPHNFYCQSLTAEQEFRKMMNDIQRIYAGRTPVEEPLEVGTAVMAVFADDGALYRAEVLELNKLRGNIVRYVDFGNCAMVETKKTFRVERQFMEMPKQAFNCTLKNVVPVNGNSWTKSNSHEIDKHFNVEKIECCFYEVKDNKYTVGMMVKGKDLAGVLVEKGLADFAVASTVGEEDKSGSGVIDAESAGDGGNCEESVSEQQPIRIDISRLEGQSLRVKVSNVEGTGRFHILLPSAGECDKGVAEFMAGKDPQVMPKLSKREVFLGSGCLVEVKGGWQRAVVISTSRSTDFDVRLIDTGAKLVIPIDCMLALPPQLAVMQNQAVECYVKNAKSDDDDVDKELKATVENKEVIIRVENVDNNRLAVSIFDTCGHKIQSTTTDPVEIISPLLPMPIIHSINKVTISHINHSKSLYLQRVSDIPVLQSLLEDLFNFYSTSGRPLDLQGDSSKLCAAQSEDENWYRARILKCTETGALVQYLDYGNPEEVPAQLIKELEPQHMIRPQLSLEVSLSVTVKGSEEEQSEILKPLLLDKEFTASLYNIRSNWITELEDQGAKISETLASQNLLQPEEDPKKPEMDPSEPDDIIVGGKYKIAVTHADNPAQFYIQRLRDLPAIDALQEKLQSEVSSYSNVEGIPEENLFCAAIYSADGLWYRAEVIDADEDIVTVRFVDFGNTDSITEKNGIKHLPESMKSIKRYGIKCRLDLIPVGEEDWSEGACEKFLTMATAKEFIDAVVIADGKPKRLELFIGDDNIGDKLVEEKLGVKVHGVEEIFDEIVHRELDPRSAFVSHINSPSEFWVQEEKFVADLETIADRFVVADMFGRIDEIQEGTLCVAKFPEDQNWYRARVISHGDTGTNVIYVDYGNSAVSTEIRQIPADIAMIPPLSRKCCLQSAEGVEQWSEKACEEFSRMADDGATIFILEVIEEGETSKVKLILEGKDISEALGELCEKPVGVVEERLSPLGEETSPNVVVSHVVSPSEFWLQADYKMAELDVMAEHLENAQSFLPLNSLTEGTICAAQFPEDSQWYRAKILCHSESETEVLYIDYGNSAVTSELRALPEDIIKIPQLSMFSSLKLPENVDCWSQEACEKFIELVADGATMFEYEEMSEDDPSVIKLSLNGQDVVEILAPLCKQKNPPEIDDELQKEAEKIQNLRDNNFHETSDSFLSVHHEINMEKRREEMTNKFGDMIIQTKSISSEHISSSTSGIEETGTSDQSSTNISSKMDSSPDMTLQKPDEMTDKMPEERVADSTESDTIEAIKDNCSIARELTADDIIELYSQPPSEAPDSVGDGGEISGIEEMTADCSFDSAAEGEITRDAEGTEVLVDAKTIQDAEERGKSISEVSGVDLSITEPEKDDKTLDKESPEEENHPSTLLDDQINPEDMNKFSKLNLYETSDVTKSSASCDLSQVNLDVDKSPEELPPKSPESSHSEKLVSEVVTDQQILKLEKKNDDEVLTVVTENVSK